MLLLILQSSLTCMAVCAGAVMSVQMLKAVCGPGMYTGYLGGLCCGHEVGRLGWSHCDSAQEHPKSMVAIVPSHYLQPGFILWCASSPTSLCSPVFAFTYSNVTVKLLRIAI